MNGFIYVIANGRGQFKVGYSKRPTARLQALQTASSDRLTLVGTTPGGVEDEKALHQHMTAHRLAGEWFADNQILASLIARMDQPEQPETKPQTLVAAVISALGGTTRASVLLGLSSPSVIANWRLRDSIPAQYVVAVAKLTKIPAAEIRPDIFGVAA